MKCKITWVFVVFFTVWHVNLYGQKAKKVKNKGRSASEMGVKKTEETEPAEAFDLLVINSFETQEENLQMGLNLLSMYHSDALQKEFPELTPEELKAMKFKSAIQDSSGQVVFRIILSGTVLGKKEALCLFFKDRFQAQIKRQMEDKAIFEEARELALVAMAGMDTNDLNEFWNHTSPFMRETTTREALETMVRSKRNRIITPGNNRSFDNQQYYERLPGAEQIDHIYLITTFIEGVPNIIENMIFQRVDGKLEIVGYNFKLQ